VRSAGALDLAEQRMRPCRVSVIVITRDRGDEAARTAALLATLPERPAVIVVDNGSTDGTPDRVRSLAPSAAVLEAGRNLGGAARNAGVAHATTPYVAFSDDDSWWAPGSLARATALLDDHPSVGLICARVLLGPEERLDPICRIMAANPLPRPDGMPGPCLAGFVACASVVRRGAFLEAGGFDQRLGVGGEEELLAIDLLSRGWHLVYADEIVAHHHPSKVRSRTLRRSNLTRNALWTAWLRRPAFPALGASCRLGWAALQDPPERRGLAAAVAGAGWVARQRRVIGPEVEAQLRLLS
jgi:GT2 family glycosyltransferase